LSLYLLHLEPGYLHARHYLRFTPDNDVSRRVAEHLAGGAKASALVRAAIQAGFRVTVARAWTGPDADRTRERQLKNGKKMPRHCPVCRERKRHPNQYPLPL
jgi:hypothetical protein